MADWLVKSVEDVSLPILKHRVSIWKRNPFFWGRECAGATAQLKPRPPQFLGSQICHNETHTVGPLYTSDQLVAEAAFYGIQNKQRTCIYVPSGIEIQRCRRMSQAAQPPGSVKPAAGMCDQCCMV